jgi:hypothetical protein
MLRKTHNKIIPLFLLSALIVGSVSTASAYEISWTDDYHTIKYIEPTLHGWFWIGLDKPASHYEKGICESTGVIVYQNDMDGYFRSDSPEARQRLMSLLMTAMLKKLKVKLNITANPSNKNCVIERVRVYAP